MNQFLKLNALNIRITQLSAAFLFDSRIKELTKEYDYTQEFKKDESFTRIFGSEENDEIKIVLQMLRKELHS